MCYHRREQDLCRLCATVLSHDLALTYLRASSTSTFDALDLAPPSSVHRTSVHADIEHFQAQKFRYEADMENRTRELDLLRITTGKIDSALTELRAQVAPVHCLPVELVREILTLAALHPVDFDEWPNKTLDETNNLSAKLPLTILNLSQVNRRWRNITLSLPVFWSSFVLYITPGAHVGDSIPTAYSTKNKEWRELALMMTRGTSALGSPTQGTLNLLHLFLERSGSHTLSVRIMCPGRSYAHGWNDSPEPGPGEQKIMQILAPHAHRLYYFAAPKPFLNSFWQTAHDQNHPPSSLGGLAITYTDGRFPVQFSSLFDQIQSTLTSLRVSSRDLHTILSSNRVYPSLNRLFIDPHQEHHSYLQHLPHHFPSLAELSIPSLMIQGSRTLDGVVYDIPGLKTVRFTNVVPMSAAWRVLSSLRLPDLQNLELSSQFMAGMHQHNSLMRAPESHIPRLLLRSECQTSLHTLSLAFICIPASELLEILLLSPQLRGFNFVGFSDERRYKTITNSFVKALAEREDSGGGRWSVVPDLRALRLKGALACDPERLLDLARKRVRPSRPGVASRHSTSLGAAAAGLDSNSEDDRCLSDFTLQWQSSKISHHIVKAFKTLSIEAGGNIEVWERDDGYVEPLPAYPTTTTAGMATEGSLGKTILARSRQLITISTLRESLDHAAQDPTLPALPTISNPQNGSTSAPTVEDLSTSLHNALSALHKLEDVPREEVQIEPMIGTQERFDDSYYTPEMRTYELRRIV